ncbi:hypothetical protein SAMN05443549_107133 [Flavobacterium fluvii]|uniref:DUF5777 domain-containing protein n=1 Tax=Flavobacterium fluvii TaxID=468056 RepID=A0A1M5N7C5_9FLAO|nr:DUF5777 family beta-barrel protein [Flavobacterium fluvii]SHG85352.1 hypothetical protein SAMN05443549_107133 [Flavobacterium fluvii]
MKLKKIIFIALFTLPMMMLAQEQKDTIAAVQKDSIPAVQEDSVPAVKEIEYERAAFESTSLIESQTNRVYSKGTIEMIMNHRFGLVNGTNDMIGIWAPANIRIALNYSITDRITVGFGTTKDVRLQDFSLKAALLKQTVDGKMPISVTYYGNWSISALPKENFYHLTDRWSFYNQLIIAKKINKVYSLQLGPSYSHYNVVDASMNNDLFALQLGGRAKVTSTMSVLLDVNQPITSQNDAPKPGFSVGTEFSTVGHTFQIFISNYRGIVNQQSNMFNQFEFFEGEFAIGFNISRTW